MDLMSLLSFQLDACDPKHGIGAVMLIVMLKMWAKAKTQEEHSDKSGDMEKAIALLVKGIEISGSDSAKDAVKELARHSGSAKQLISDAVEERHAKDRADRRAKNETATVLKEAALEATG